MLVRDLPGLLYELLPAELAAIDALFAQLALDHVLGRDAGVVGSDHPERRLAEHPVEAHEDILEGILETVAHMEDPRHVRGRDYHDIGLLAGLSGGLEKSLPHPGLVDAVFEALGIVGFLKLDRFHRGIPPERCFYSASRPAAPWTA